MGAGLPLNEQNVTAAAERAIAALGEGWRYMVNVPYRGMPILSVNYVGIDFTCIVDAWFDGDPEGVSELRLDRSWWRINNFAVNEFELLREVQERLSAAQREVYQALLPLANWR